MLPAKPFYSINVILNRVNTANLQNTSGYVVLYHCYSVFFSGYIPHPQSQYFGVGKIQPDQFEDYLQRKGMSKDELTRWLRPRY